MDTYVKSHETRINDMLSAHKLSNTSINTVKTADNSNVAIYTVIVCITLLVISGIVLTELIIYKRKQE